MFRRRPLLRAAAVGGGAYMAGKHVARNQAEQAQTESDQDQRISDLEQQQGYQQPPPQQYQQAPPQYQQAPPPPPAAPQSSPMIDQLNQLAALHQQGVLSDDEFTAAKAKLFAT
jgi:type IV secretory pathway VirB10-like protein